MIRALANVVRGEGIASAACRAAERIAEAAESFGDVFRSTRGADLINYAPGSFGARTGGVAVQLRARLAAERQFRRVAIARTLPSSAKALHVEGTAGLDGERVLRLIDRGATIVVSVHDETLIADAHARELLGRAAAVIFPSRFLLDVYQATAAPGSWQALVIEPASPATPIASPRDADGVAFVGAVRRDKGAHLLSRAALLLAERGHKLHIFGGGDAEVFALLRRLPDVVIRGYYRAATLPALLSRHRVGLVLLPSIVPESFCLTLTETWLAGAAAGMFDIGAPAQRIREQGGGWLAPRDSGEEGLAAIVSGWLDGARTRIPTLLPTPESAARAHIALYRDLSLLPPR